MCIIALVARRETSRGSVLSCGGLVEGGYDQLTERSLGNDRPHGFPLLSRSDMMVSRRFRAWIPAILRWRVRFPEPSNDPSDGGTRWHPTQQPCIVRAIGYEGKKVG